jgi:hypothetical protein
VCWTLIGAALVALGAFTATLSITGYLYTVDTLYSLP